MLTWAEGARRDLPWRRTRDPWSVLVSEFMLQRTPVHRVIPRYHAFLERFPTVGDCAAASVADVVRLWAGLGYNRRALQLHRTARTVTIRHGGQLPASLAELLRLPGVGAYTARAVLAFAFESDVGVLDANATRILSRVLGRAAVQADADALVPRGQGWTWNQAVMDLGATVCRARAACATCPLAAADLCIWHRTGSPQPDPWPRGPGQSTFEGSDRQGRGRLVGALRAGSVAWPQVPAAAGWPEDPERAWRTADRLVADGLAAVTGGRLRLC